MKISLHGTDRSGTDFCHLVHVAGKRILIAELLAWQAQTGAKRTFLVHGDDAVMTQFAGRLAGTRVEMPEPNQAFEL